jgi:hypothetical protein
MTSSMVEASARVMAVELTQAELVVSLTDGRKIVVPLTWFPRLLHATEAQRNGWELLDDGVGIHWDEIDEDLSVAGLLRGTPASAATH